MDLLAGLHGNLTAYSQECVDFITEVSVPHLQLLQQYLELSGHGINQIGSYDECMAVPNSSYYLCFAADPAPGFVGICFSKACTATDIKQLSQLFEVFKFTKVMEPQQEELTTGGYVTLAVLGLFILITLLSTLLVAIRKKTNKLTFLDSHDYFALQRSLKVFTRQGEIKFLNGIKSVCFLTVVFGHEMFLRIWNMQNIINLQNQLQKPYMALALSYIFAVDVFFYLGGFMLGFLFLKQLSRRKSWQMFAMAVLQRWLRLAPVFLMCMFLYWKVMPAAGAGPLYYQYKDATVYCEDGWWKDLLFFGNFSKNMCMVWGWYIQIDMQLFLVSLCLLWLYTSFNRKIFGAVTALIVVGGITYCFVRCQMQGYHVIGNLDGANNPNSDDYYLDLYNKPWSRTGPYLLGLLVGIYYYHYKERETLKAHKDLLQKTMEYRVARWLCFAAGLTIIVSLTWAPHSLLEQVQWTQLQNSLYISLGRLSYSFGVCLLTLPMLLGYSNPLKTLLECTVFQYISKLAFSCYLIHYCILSALVYNVRTSQYVNPALTLIRGTADLAPILAAGFILAVTIQFPLGALCDKLLGRKQPPHRRKDRSQ